MLSSAPGGAGEVKKKLVVEKLMLQTIGQGKFSKACYLLYYRFPNEYYQLLSINDSNDTKLKSLSWI